MAHSRKPVYLFIGVTLALCLIISYSYFLNVNSLITENEALRIAMPFIEQNAIESNRIVADVNATFYAKLNHQPRPAWHIQARYVTVKDLSSSQHWIIGYSILVWADTGEIQSANENGIM